MLSTCITKPLALGTAGVVGLVQVANAGHIDFPQVAVNITFASTDTGAGEVIYAAKQDPITDQLRERPVPEKPRMTQQST